MIWALLVADLRGGLHRVQRRPWILGLALLGGVCLGVPVLSAITAVGYALANVAPQLGELALVTAFTGAALAMLVLGPSGLITAFFTDRKLLLLATAPVPKWVVFSARLASSIWTNALFGAALLAGLIGYGSGRPAGLIYWLAALVATVWLVLAVTAFQLVLLSLILRVVPAERARDAAALAAVVVSVGFALSWAGVISSGAVGRSILRQRLPELATSLAVWSDRTNWIPTAWPARALVSLAEGDVEASLPWLALCVLVLVVLIGLAYWLYRAAFQIGILVFAEGAGGRRRQGSSAPTRIDSPGPASPVQALVRKDWLTLRRDTKRLAGTLPAVVVAGAYPFILGGGYTGGASRFWLSALGAIMLPFMLATSLAMPAVPGEGRGFALLRLAPISPARFLVAKLAFAGPPVLIISLLGGALLGRIRGGSPADVAELVALLAWLALGFTALCIAGGALAPNFAAANPRRGVPIPAVLLAFAGMLLFTVLSGSALALFLFTPLQMPGLAALMIVGAVGLLVVAAGLAAGYLLVAAARLRRWDVAAFQ
jgi:hypothetical protein